MPKKRKKAKEEKYSSRLITGLSLGYICAAALLAVFAVLIKKDVIDIDAKTLIVIAVNIASCFVCGLAVTRRGEGNIISGALVPGIIYALIIAVISLIIDPNAFKFDEAMKIMLISVAGSTTGSIIKLCNSNKKYHK